LGETRTLLLSPDGGLTLSPWGALVDEDGRYLVESYSLTYVLSGRDLVRYASQPAPARQPPVVVGAPDFGAVGETRGRLVASERGEGRGWASIDMARIFFKP